MTDKKKNILKATIDADINPAISSFIPAKGRWTITAKGGSAEAAPYNSEGVLIEPYDTNTIYHAYINTLQKSNNPVAYIGFDDFENKKVSDPDSSIINIDSNTHTVFMSGNSARSYYDYDFINNNGNKTKRSDFESYMDSYIAAQKKLVDDYPSLSDIKYHATDRVLLNKKASVYMNTFSKYVLQKHDLFFRICRPVESTLTWDKFKNEEVFTLIELLKIKANSEYSDSYSGDPINVEYRVNIETDDIRYSYFPDYINLNADHTLEENPLWLCLAVKKDNDIKLVYFPSQQEIQSIPLSKSKQFYFPVYFDEAQYKKPENIQDYSKTTVYKVSFDLVEVVFYALLKFGSEGPIDWSVRENYSKIVDYFKDDKKVAADLISLFGTVIPEGQNKKTMFENSNSMDPLSIIATNYTKNKTLQDIISSTDYDLYYAVSTYSSLLSELGEFGSHTVRYPGNPVNGANSFRFGTLFGQNIIINGSTGVNGYPDIRTGFCYRLFPSKNLDSYSPKKLSVYSTCTIKPTKLTGNADLDKGTELEKEKEKDYRQDFYINPRSYDINLAYQFSNIKEDRQCTVNKNYNTNSVFVVQLNADGKGLSNSDYSRLKYSRSKINNWDDAQDVRASIFQDPYRDIFYPIIRLSSDSSSTSFIQNIGEPYNVIMPLGYQSSNKFRVLNDKFIKAFKSSDEKTLFSSLEKDENYGLVQNIRFRGPLHTQYSLNANLDKNNSGYDIVTTATREALNTGYAEDHYEFITGNEYSNGSKITEFKSDTNIGKKVFLYIIDPAKLSTRKVSGTELVPDNEFKIGVSWASVTDGAIENESSKLILTDEPKDYSEIDEKSPFVAARLYRTSEKSLSELNKFVKNSLDASYTGIDINTSFSSSDFSDFTGGEFTDKIFLNRSDVQDDKQFNKLYDTLKTLDFPAYILAVSVYQDRDGLIRIHLLDSDETLLVSKTKENIPAELLSNSISSVVTVKSDSTEKLGLSDTEIDEAISVSTNITGKFADALKRSVVTYLNNFIDQEKSAGKDKKIISQSIKNILSADSKTPLLLTYKDPEYDSIIDILCGDGVLKEPKPFIPERVFILEKTQYNLSSDGGSIEIKFTSYSTTKQNTKVFEPIEDEFTFIAGDIQNGQAEIKQTSETGGVITVKFNKNDKSKDLSKVLKFRQKSDAAFEVTGTKEVTVTIAKYVEPIPDQPKRKIPLPGFRFWPKKGETYDNIKIVANKDGSLSTNITELRIYNCQWVCQGDCSEISGPGCKGGCLTEDDTKDLSTIYVEQISCQVSNELAPFVDEYTRQVSPITVSDSFFEIEPRLPHTENDNGGTMVKIKWDDNIKKTVEGPWIQRLIREGKTQLKGTFYVTLHSFDTWQITNPVNKKYITQEVISIPITLDFSALAEDKPVDPVFDDATELTVKVDVAKYKEFLKTNKTFNNPNQWFTDNKIKRSYKFYFAENADKIRDKYGKKEHGDIFNFVVFLRHYNPFQNVPGFTDGTVVDWGDGTIQTLNSDDIYSDFISIYNTYQQNTIKAYEEEEQKEKEAKKNGQDYETQNVPYNNTRFLSERSSFFRNYRLATLKDIEAGYNNALHNYIGMHFYSIDSSTDDTAEFKIKIKGPFKDINIPITDVYLRFVKWPVGRSPIAEDLRIANYKLDTALSVPLIKFTGLANIEDGPRYNKSNPLYDRNGHAGFNYDFLPFCLKEYYYNSKNAPLSFVDIQLNNVSNSITNYSHLLSECIRLTHIDEKAFEFNKSINISDVNNAFSMCRNLTNIPKSFFSTLYSTQNTAKDNQPEFIFDCFAQCESIKEYSLKAQDGTYFWTKIPDVYSPYKIEKAAGIFFRQLIELPSDVDENSVRCIDRFDNEGVTITEIKESQSCFARKPGMWGGDPQAKCKSSLLMPDYFYMSPSKELSEIGFDTEEERKYNKCYSGYKQIHFRGSNDLWNFW